LLNLFDMDKPEQILFLEKYYDITFHISDGNFHFETHVIFTPKDYNNVMTPYMFVTKTQWVKDSFDVKPLKQTSYLTDGQIPILDHIGGWSSVTDYHTYLHRKQYDEFMSHLVVS